MSVTALIEKSANIMAPARAVCMGTALVLLLFAFPDFTYAQTNSTSPSAQNPDARLPNSTLYEPLVLFGDPDATKTVFFFWSAVSNESIKEFHARIAPVARLGKKAGIKLVLSQVLDTRFHDLNGPGAYLLCTDDYKKYVHVATAYLAQADNVTKLRLDKQTALYSNATIQRMISKKTITPAGCTAAGFFARQALGLEKTKTYLQRFDRTSPPLYVVDGKTYLPSDDFIRKIFETAATRR